MLKLPETRPSSWRMALMTNVRRSPRKGSVISAGWAVATLAAITVLPVANSAVTGCSNRSPLTSATSVEIASAKPAFAASGPAGWNSARRPSAERVVWPAIDAAPRSSRIPPTVPGLIGSLNTTTMRALSGTSRLPGGGSVRTTPGRCVTGTLRVKVWVPPPANSTCTASTSPACASICTGSKPPASIAAVTLLPVRVFRMVARPPLGTVPGCSDT